MELNEVLIKFYFFGGGWRGGGGCTFGGGGGGVTCLTPKLGSDTVLLCQDEKFASAVVLLNVLCRMSTLRVEPESRSVRKTAQDAENLQKPWSGQLSRRQSLLDF